MFMLPRGLGRSLRYRCHVVVLVILLTGTLQLVHRPGIISGELTVVVRSGKGSNVDLLEAVKVELSLERRKFPVPKVSYGTEDREEGGVGYS